MESTNRPHVTWITLRLQLWQERQSFERLLGPQRASTGWRPFLSGWWRYSECITRLYSIHLSPNVLLKDQEEIWALINREWSQYLGPGGCIKPYGSINQCRNLQDWWFYFQKRRWLVKTLGLHQKCISSGVKIDGSNLKPFSMVQAIRSKTKTYLKVLSYRQRGFINFDLTFQPRLK